MCWLFIDYCVVLTSTPHAVFAVNRLWAGFKGFLFLFTSFHWWLRSYPLNLSPCGENKCSHSATSDTKYTELQSVIASSNRWWWMRRFPKLVQRQVELYPITLRRLCIQNDIQMSGVNQCFVTVSFLMWIQQIALWFALVLRRCQRHPKGSGRKASGLL